MSKVAVYKTDITNSADAKAVINTILMQLPDSDPSIDLEDRDNVLRVESKNGRIDERKIKHLVENKGFQLYNLL